MIVDQYISTPAKSNGQATAKKPQIWPEHEEILRVRAISVQYAEKAGIHSIDLAGLKRNSEKYGFKIRGGLPDNLPLHRVTGLAITYPNCVDGVARVRVRSDVTSYLAGEGADAHDIPVPRYVCQSGVSVAPYFTDEALDIAVDVTKPIYITEAPLKACSLSDNGWPAIGLGGVLAGAHDTEAKRDNEEIVASKEMTRIKWRGRKAYIVFDAGIANNPNVALGAAYIYEALRKLGAIVSIVRVPWMHPEDSDPVNGKFFSPTDQGPDDFIFRNGKEAFQKLIDESVPADPAERMRQEIETIKLRKERSPRAIALLEELVVQACLHVGGPLVVDGTASAAKAADVGKKSVQTAAKLFAGKLGSGAEKESWKDDFQCAENGSVKPIAYNIELCLRNDKKLDKLIAYDEFLQCVIFRRTPPWTDEYFASRATKDGTPWCDEDNTRLSSYVTTNHGIVDTRTEKIQAALGVVAADHKFHPVRQYLRSLKWDGVPRLDTYAQEYLHADASLAEYYRLVVPMWFISAVARVEEPGCQLDYALVLEGEQGDGKTTSLRVLGGEWYSDASQDDLRDKEAVMKLFGSWIFVFDEGAILSKADARVLKDFLTKVDDDYIPKFSNLKRRFERQCVFALTTNDHQYLSDPTGNRRFWPVLCGEIDIEKIKADRDQLWAEAYARYKNGERRYPTKDEEAKLIVPEQEKRRRPEVWEELFAEKLVGYNEVTLRQIFVDLLGRKETEIDQADRIKASNTLTALGWRQAKPRKVNGVAVRVYCRPGHEPSESTLVPSRPLTHAQEIALKAFEAAFGVEMTLESSKSGQVLRVWREREASAEDAMGDLIEQV